MKITYEKQATGGLAAVQDTIEKILEGNFNKGVRSLDFSDPVIELSLREGEDYEGSFTIFGPENEVTAGIVSSTRLRMRCLTERFSGPREEIQYFLCAL